MRRMIVLTAVALAASSCGVEDETPADCQAPAASSARGIVVGALFPVDVSERARLQLAALKLAVEQINEAGALAEPLTLINQCPTKAGSWDTAEAAAQARALQDDHDAVALVTGLSSIARAVIDATAEAPYDELVQCSGAATHPTLNRDVQGRAHNDNRFYRTVVHDFFQSALQAKLAVDNDWDKLAIYSVADPDGAGLRDALLRNRPIRDNVIWNEQHPPGLFDRAATEAEIDDLVRASRDGTVNALLLASTDAQSPAIVDELTARGFAAPIVLSASSRSDAIFGRAATLETWLAGAPSNRLIGTEPDNDAFENSAAFNLEFRAKTGDEPDPFGATVYDCGFAVGLALAYAGSDRSREGVHKAFRKLELRERTDDEIEVGIGSDGIAAAVAAIADGHRISYQGASGPLDFDDSGDRPVQPLRTFGPNGAGDGWEIKDKLSLVDLGDYL